MRQINCSKWWWCESFYLFTMHYVHLSLSLSLVYDRVSSMHILVYNHCTSGLQTIRQVQTFTNMMECFLKYVWWSSMLYVIFLWIRNLRELPLRLLPCGDFFKYTLMRSIMPRHKILKTGPVFSKFLPCDKLSSTNQSLALCHAVPSY